MKARDITAIAALDRGLPERFWSKVSRLSSGCWEWTGAKSKVEHGFYGVIRIAGENYGAHRIAFVLNGGTLHAGMVIDHLCRNKLCVNPDHLEGVTQKENARRGLAGQWFKELQLSKTHCPKGHLYDETNTRIRKDGCRACRKCQRENNRRRRLGFSETQRRKPPVSCRADTEGREAKM